MKKTRQPAAMDNALASTQASTKNTFVIIRDGYDDLTEKEDQLLKSAYTLLKKKKAKVGYTTTQKVLQQHSRYAGFKYIIPRFHGDLFMHLKKLKARIYGPLAIIHAMNVGNQVPRSDVPLLALYLNEFNVTFTGLSSDERKMLIEKIQYLGGNATGDLSSETTHLIANTCDPSSDKYRAATKHDIEVVFPRWVDFFYELALNGHENPDDLYKPEEFHVPPLHGCLVTCSGHTGEIRLTISNSVKALGGQFAGSMDRVKTTHLIIESTTGEKFKRAQEWGNIKIVTMQWLSDCLRKHQRFPEGRYYPGQKTSTLNENNATLEDPGISAIFSDGNRSRIPASISSASNSSVTASDNIQSIARHDRFEFPPQSPFSARRVSNIALPLLSVERDEPNRLSEKFKASPMRRTKSFEQELEAFHICSARENENEQPANNDVNEAAEPHVDHNSSMDDYDPFVNNQEKDEGNLQVVPEQQHLLHNDINPFEHSFDDDEPQNAAPFNDNPAGISFGNVPTPLASSTPRVNKASSDVGDIVPSNQSTPRAPVHHPVPEALLEKIRQSNAARLSAINDKTPQAFHSRRLSSPKDAGNNGLENLSMALNEYIEGGRQVTLHYPFEQMMNNIPTIDADPDSPTIDLQMLKRNITQMAKNSCPSDSYYERAMGPREEPDEREWRDRTIWQQHEVDHGFKSPLKAYLFNQAPPNHIEDFEDDAHQPLGPSFSEVTHKALSEMQIEDVAEDMEEVQANFVVSDESSKRESQRKKSDPLRLLPPALLQRCEAIASNQPTPAFPLSFTDEVEPQQAPSVETHSQFNFAGSTQSEPQLGHPVDWDGKYASPTLKSNKENQIIILSASQSSTLDDKYFASDSADPFQRLSKQKAAEKASKGEDDEPKHAEESTIVANKENVSEKTSEAAKEAELNDSANAFNVNEKEIEEPIGNHDELVDSFNTPLFEDEEVFPEIRKMKPVRPRLFASIPEEDNIIPNEVDATLCKIRPKVQATPIIPTVTLESSANTGNPSVQVIEEQEMKTRNSSFETPRNAPLRSSQRLKRKAEEEERSKAVEPEVKKGKTATASRKYSSRSTRRSSRASINNTTVTLGKDADDATETLNRTDNALHRHFVFTSFAHVEREKLQAMVREFHGTNLDHTTDFLIADVVVCDRLQRSEKILCALASGKYVVPSSYVIACSRDDCFLSLEDFEYGNPKSARKRINFDQYRGEEPKRIAKLIIDSCYRWRLKVEAMKKGAFYDWKVILFCSTNIDYYRRIITTGGGTIKHFTEVRPNEYRSYNMGIVVTNKDAGGCMSEKEYQLLHENKIPYFTEFVIAEYLLLIDTAEAKRKNYHANYQQYCRENGIRF